MVNNGQSVKAGQQIATMGSTDADSVRLHFQIRYRATAIDPLRYLPPQGSKPKCKKVILSPVSIRQACHRVRKGYNASRTSSRA